MTADESEARMNQQIVVPADDVDAEMIDLYAQGVSNILGRPVEVVVDGLTVQAFEPQPKKSRRRKV